jgi:hypothetical protein
MNPTGIELTRGPNGELWLKVEHAGKQGAINLLSIGSTIARDAFVGWAEEQLGPAPYADVPSEPPIHWLKPDAPNVRAIAIMDGPHKGFIHEVEAGWPVPEGLGLRTVRVHHYRVEGDKAYYEHSEEEVPEHPRYTEDDED